MNIVAHLQELEDLIVAQTKPPVTAILRNKLHFAIEQAEAHSLAVERQEKTLAKQIKTIEGFMENNKKLIDENSYLKAEIARRDSDSSANVFSEEIKPFPYLGTD